VRLRDVMAVLVGLVVLGVVGYGGWWWLSETLEGDEAAPAEPGGDALATGLAFLDAWERGAHDELATYVIQPAAEDLAERHDQLIDAFEPRTLVLTPGALVEDVDGRARLPVAVAVELAELSEPIRWEVELRLLRRQGVWAVDWTLSSLHPELRPTWRFGRESEELDRAPILAVDGTPLAGSGVLVTFGFEPSAVEDADAVVAAFAEAIPGSEARAERELARTDLVDGWFYPVATVSQSRAQDAAPILREASGILRQESDGRTRYEDEFARHIVGVVAEATAEQLDELGPPYEVGDEVGQFGLERRFERELVSGSIVRVGLRDGDEGPLRVVFAEQRAGGSRPVQTTIDVEVQAAVENALIAVGGPAAIVVVDGRDGAIAGSASRPLTGFNRALEGRYPPGSTFKVVTADALLASGASPDDPVTCPAEVTVGGLRVPNAGGIALGDTTLEGAFAASCNTTFAQLAAAAGAEALEAAATRFGFGVEPSLPLAAFGGSFPAPADTAEVAAAAFGQARVEVSPLHLASVAAATTTGVWREPFLLVGDGPGESRQLGTGTRDPLQRMLRTAVTAGTGQEAEVEGAEVRGKTGTAQGTDGVEHAWFIGTYGPYGFAILVEDGGAGGQIAAPIAGRLVRELIDLLGSGLGGGDPDATPDDAQGETDPSEDAPTTEDGATELGSEPEGPLTDGAVTDDGATGSAGADPDSGVADPNGEDEG
jgi:cell division protein FtsI/penicillin-binding protein 2